MLQIVGKGSWAFDTLSPALHPSSMLPQIRKLSPRHDAIMEWLLANPHRSLRECASTFEVTQSWLSCIVHSDIFKARYQALLGEFRDERIIPLRDKIVGVAHEALDGLAKEVASAPTETKLDIANAMVKALGYGTGPKVQVNAPGGVVAVTSAVTPEDLERARERLRASQRMLANVEEKEVVALEQRPAHTG